MSLGIGMTVTALWEVTTCTVGGRYELSATPSGHTLFSAVQQNNGFVVSASSHPRHRPSMPMSYQGSDNLLRLRPARFATVFTSGIKKKRRVG